MRAERTTHKATSHHSAPSLRRLLVAPLPWMPPAEETTRRPTWPQPARITTKARRPSLPKKANASAINAPSLPRVLSMLVNEPMDQWMILAKNPTAVVADRCCIFSGPTTFVMHFCRQGYSR
nr:hypothetical protein [Pandoravirus aubagnensis]